MAKTGKSADAPARERVGEHVTIFRRQDVWWAEFLVEKKQRRISLKTRNLKRARQEALRLEVSLQEGTHKVPQKAPLLSDLAAEYLAYLTVEGRSVSTLKRYKPEINRFVQFASDRGVLRANDFSVRLFDQYRARRVSEKAESATIYHESTVLKQLLNFAVQRELMPFSPLKNAKLKKPSKRTQPAFDLEQVELILKHAGKRWRDVFEFLACTGLRIGELCWLTWEDIDEASGFVLVRGKRDWRPKDKDDRKVPFNDRLQALLQRLPRSPGWVFKGGKCKRFPKGGQQISGRRALSALKRTLERAGLDEGKLHTFRSFFITHSLLNGVGPYVVADWVGHSSLDMVMRYFRMLKNDSRKAMVKVSFSAALPVSAAVPAPAAVAAAPTAAAAAVAGRVCEAVSERDGI